MNNIIEDIKGEILELKKNLIANIKIFVMYWLKVKCKGENLHLPHDSQ